MNDEMVRETRRRYHGQVSYIDYQLGRFFGELRSRGMYDDTAILFDADHGEHLGDHGIFGKTTFLCGSGDVPLVMRFPDWAPRAHAARGTSALEISAPALTADLHPTILDLAGLAPTGEVDGLSLLPWIEAGTAFATDGRLVAVEAELDEHALRGRNPCAWRGPMRYGQGYGGGW